MFLSCGVNTVNILKCNTPTTSTNYNQTQCYQKNNDIMGIYINKTRVFEMGLTGLLEVAIFSPESLARNPDWFVRIPMRCDSWLATGC